MAQEQHRATSGSGEEKSGKPLVVAVCGSAGALATFEEFFRLVPADAGIVFVVIQHMDPNRKAYLPEILQRATAMPVVTATEGMRAKPDRVHIIPPDASMTIEDSVLHLATPIDGVRMTIDHFLRHLAADQKERAVCVILSGSGTDGTLGLRAIREHMGLSLVQDPETAQFDSMPRSAADTGLADLVAPVKELAATVLKQARRSASGRPSLAGVRISADRLGEVFSLLRARTGHDFSYYKKNTILRRINRRMDVHQVETLQRYVAYIRENPHEIDLLFKEFLIGVTNFFRDPEAFDTLRRTALTEIVATQGQREEIRVWTPGCSTGEEAYSVAILLREVLEEQAQRKPVKVQVFATDIDNDAIERARLGVYPVNIAADISPERLSRFFVTQDGTYRIRQDIREMVVFAPQNLIMDPPFTRLDLILCRNLLIYMSSELQQRIIPMFHYALRSGGFLFLGSSETVGTFGELFEPVDPKTKLFRRRDAAGAPSLADMPSSLVAEAAAREHRSVPGVAVRHSLTESAQRVLLEGFTPSAAFINEKGDILYINGRTGKYLEPPAGKANLNIFAMAREGLRYELNAAVRKAVTERTEVVAKSIKVKTNGDFQPINLLIRPLQEPEALRGALLAVFEDVAPPRRRRGERLKEGERDRKDDCIADLEEELKRSREQLQTTVEEMETSQEELKSANEELQSTNEELQSTNEELTTSKEELQSLNEELTTVNAELQSKIDELSHTNSDMKNLLNSTEIATLFLDRDLNVKRFTTQATKVIHLIASDVGRPISHLATNLVYNRLPEDAREVVETLVYKEKNVQTTDGKWYLMRIHPYRTLDNVIDGTVVTFVDITSMKALEASLEKARAYARAMAETAREPILALDGAYRVATANRAFYKLFKEVQAEVEGQVIYGIGNGGWDIPVLHRLLEETLPVAGRVEDVVFEHDFPGLGPRSMVVNATRQTHEQDGSVTILLAFEEMPGSGREGAETA